MILSFKEQQMIIRHGDVVVEKIKELPEALKKIEIKPLALGEVTGHSHRVLVADPIDLEMHEDNEGKLYFQLKSQGQLVHEEHKTITLEPGIYTTKIQRVYDYVSEETKKASD